MHYLFESDDRLSTPIECFYYDTETMPFPVKPHLHYFMEIILIIEGSAQMRSENQQFTLSEGDMILFHPKSVHAIYLADNSDKSSARLRYAVLKFDINCLNATSTYTPKLRSVFRSAEKREMSIVFPRGFSDIDIGRIFSDCIEETQKNLYGFDILVRTRIYELLIRMLRFWQQQGFCIDSETFEEDGRYDIHNITEFIDAHLTDGISVEDIARHCGMSYSYFAKKFRELYGRSCKEYMEAMRLFKVEEFLMFTEFDLNYIAQETGFSDCSHMIKSFRSSRGITPKKFRQNRAAGTTKTGSQ